MNELTGMVVDVSQVSKCVTRCVRWRFYYTHIYILLNSYEAGCLTFELIIKTCRPRLSIIQ